MSKILKKYNNYQFGGRIKTPTVIDWYNPDSKETLEKSSEEHKNIWKKVDDITYRLNTYGFRCEEFPEEECRESITILGCSQTFGIGLQKENTWASLLCKELNLREINLSIAGGSLDSAFRVYNEWQPIHKSKITCILMPPTTRLESTSIERNSWKNIGNWTIENYIRSGETNLQAFLLELLEESLQEVREERNLAAIKYIANQTDSEVYLCYYLDNDDKKNVPWLDVARDGCHGGPKWNKRMRDLFLEKIRNKQIER